MQAGDPDSRAEQQWRMAVENIRAKNLQQQAIATDECAQHEGAYLEHAALATQAAKAAARMRWWERLRAGSLAPGQDTLAGLKQSGALKTAEGALRAARAQRIVEMTGVRLVEGGGSGGAGEAAGLEMAREAADGAVPTQAAAACGAAVRVSLTAARLQGGLRALKDLEDSLGGNTRTGASIALERQLTAQRTHLLGHSAQADPQHGGGGSASHSNAIGQAARADKLSQGGGQARRQSTTPGVPARKTTPRNGTATAAPLAAPAGSSRPQTRGSGVGDRTPGAAIEAEVEAAEADLLEVRRI